MTSSLVAVCALRACSIAVLGMVLVVAGGGVIAVPAAAADLATCASTPVVAHRGILKGGVTENSIRAVRQAIDRQLPFEVDLRTTADNKLVVMHDQTIRRTTRGRGKVSRMTGRQIRRHKLDDGQTVPYVGKILRLVRNQPTAYALLDLKALNPATQRALRDLIVTYGIAERVEILSFHRELIAEFRSRNPGVDTYLIITGTQLPSIRRATRHGGVRVYARLVTPDWDEAMDAAGVPFAARLADNHSSWKAAVATGVANIMSDQVPAYRDWCASVGGAPV